MRRLIGAVVVGATVVVGGRLAQAEALRYDAPAVCPDASAFEDAVFAAMGRRSIASGIGLSVAIGPDGREAELILTGPDGEVLGRRRVEADGDCAELIDAVALTAALALGPLGESTASEPEPPEPEPPEPPEPEAPEPEPPEPPEPKSPVERDPAQSAEIRRHAAMGAAMGLHPGLAMTLEGGLRLQRVRWSLGASIRLTGAPGWIDGEVAAGRIRSASAALGLLACGRWTGFEACPGLRAGVERHWGVDFEQDGISTGPWLGASARFSWTFEGTPAWGPMIEVVAPLSRLNLTVDGSTAWTTPAVGIVGGVDVRW